MDDQSFVQHGEHPFREEKGARGPARRFRGRIASPVTLWTSGSVEQPVGLTVGSLLIAEGEPSIALGLLNDLSDLYDSIADTERFVIHIAHASDRVLADRFAGLRPSPGGLFVGLNLEPSEWGPVLTDLKERAYCRLIDTSEAGYQRLVRAEIEKLDLGEIADPLVHFRGGYRSLSD